MTRVTASLPAELGVALEQSARANERSLAAEIRLALREHLLGSSSHGRTGNGAAGLPPLAARQPTASEQA